MSERAQQGLHVERAAEKQAARDRDAADVREGRRTADQVNEDNSLAHGLMHRLKMRPGFGVS